MKIQARGATRGHKARLIHQLEFSGSTSTRLFATAAAMSNFLAAMASKKAESDVKFSYPVAIEA
jgi:hypothetical protein